MPTGGIILIMPSTYITLDSPRQVLNPLVLLALFHLRLLINLLEAHGSLLRCRGAYLHRLLQRRRRQPTITRRTTTPIITLDQLMLARVAVLWNQQHPHGLRTLMTYIQPHHLSATFHRHPLCLHPSILLRRRCLRRVALLLDNRWMCNGLAPAAGDQRRLRGCQVTKALLQAILTWVTALSGGFSLTCLRPFYRIAGM